MGYTHGKKWSNELIEATLKEVIKVSKITSFPSRKIMREVTGNEALGVAVTRSGGSKYWAERLGLEVKPCESKMGYEFECECLNFLISILGYDCELTKARYPYDIIANNNIKIDVKSGHLYDCKNGRFYTFNLEKSMPTCDIYVCYCIDEEKTQKVYVIPSCILSGKTQLSIGENKSKYDRYIDNWDVIKQYDDFYNSFNK